VECMQNKNVHEARRNFLKSCRARTRQSGEYESAAKALKTPAGSWGFCCARLLTAWVFGAARIAAQVGASDLGYDRQPI